MIFRNGTHAEEWAAAIYRADAHRDDDTANPYFGASLFLITAVPGLYDRVKEHIHNGWADYSEMLEMNLSSGERLIVELAGNFTTAVSSTDTSRRTLSRNWTQIPWSLSPEPLYCGDNALT